MFEFDKASKWLIQKHGDSILRLAGLRDVTAWRPLPAEVVQPRQLPDGLLEVQLAGEEQRDLFVVEVATYPDERVHEQLLRDMLLVFADRRVLPEVVVLVLRPKGRLQVDETHQLQSRHGWSRLSAGWRVVELWTVPAEQLLALQDPGLVPWVLLANITGPPEPVLQRCRALIDQQVTVEERPNLLAVCQVLAKLRYNDPAFLALFGGRQAMIESPLIQEIVAEARQDNILRALELRLGAVPPEIATVLRTVFDEQKLRDLFDFAIVCPDLNAFRAKVLP
jgi:predicted transposase YdaD